MGRTSITKKLHSYKTEDIYTLMLFALSELKEVPEYKTLSELVYLLDRNSVKKVLQYYGGTTIKFPTMEELQLVLDSLLIYQYMIEDNISFDNALKIIKLNNPTYKFNVKEIKTCYDKLNNVLQKYDFKRD
nr:MAG TPA: Mor transcription activator family [Caudoviricetes sp.]